MSVSSFDGVPWFLIDAFADRPFAGNPAAVVLLSAWPDDRWLQTIAAEMNQSETSFLVPAGEKFELRWFTPLAEVSLCGHATLAAAAALWTDAVHAPRESLRFSTLSGVLTAQRQGAEIELDFPVKRAAACAPPSGLIEALTVRPTNVARNAFDFLVEVATDAEVRAASPHFADLAKIDARGVILTAKSGDPRYDFVSRFFAPAVGVPEDPVTGSAHCCLADYWGTKFGKNKMMGYQASRRGGAVGVERVGERVKLFGQAFVVAQGSLRAPTPGS
jgi:predicted PhzF superfamily epimerase YddE/YHI9